MQNYRKIMLNIPAPYALPIIGHAHLMIGLNNEGKKHKNLKKNLHLFNNNSLIKRE
jgi:hypothetical protein